MLEGGGAVSVSFKHRYGHRKRRSVVWLRSGDQWRSAILEEEGGTGQIVEIKGKWQKHTTRRKEDEEHRQYSHLKKERKERKEKATQVPRV